LEFGVLVFVEGGKPENPEKNPRTRTRTRTNIKLYPHVTPGLGIESGPHWWAGSALTTAPPLRHPCSPNVGELKPK